MREKRRASALRANEVIPALQERRSATSCVRTCEGGAAPLYSPITTRSMPAATQRDQMEHEVVQREKHREWLDENERRGVQLPRAVEGERIGCAKHQEIEHLLVARGTTRNDDRAVENGEE